MRFDSAVDEKELLGKCTVHFKNIKYTYLLDARMELMQTGYLHFNSYRFDVIENELWFVEYQSSEIHVLDFDGNEIEILYFSSLGHIRSVLKFESFVVFASCTIR